VSNFVQTIEVLSAYFFTMVVWMILPIVIPVFSIVILIFAAQIRRRALSFVLATLLKNSRSPSLLNHFRSACWCFEFMIASPRIQRPPRPQSQTLHGTRHGKQRYRRLTFTESSPTELAANPRALPRAQSRLTTFD
jgi:hypothetical protein